MMACPLPLSFLRLALVVGAVLLQSCASAPEMDMMLGESSGRAVYLERIPDRSIQAAHPIRIDQDTLMRVLRGISVTEDPGLVRGFIAGEPTTTPAFTEDEIRYLAPLIAEGLLQAAPDQQVGFRLIHSGFSGRLQSVGAGVGSSDPPLGSPQRETSRGSLYAYGRSLYVTLHEYRARSERADIINMANRRISDPTGLMKRRVTFFPESARRPDSYRRSESTEATMVIDYELLASLPAGALPIPSGSSSTTGQASSPPGTTAEGMDAQLRTLQEQMRQKNTELEELRKELEEIRRQVTETPSGSMKSLTK